jgi:ferric-dicitrate binding protein FerR (iron transport regulator)
MNPSDTQQNIPDTVAPRIQRLIDDDLTDDELAALESELMESPEAMETYHDFLALHCALEEQIDSAQVVKPQSVVPIERILAHQRKRIIKTSLIAAAAVILITAVTMFFLPGPDRQTPLANFQIAPGSSFTLTHSGEADAPLGKTMIAGSRFVLQHGVAELNLPHDVRAVIEAPAEMLLRDDRTLELDHGRALFQVNSADGHGFTVVTPHQSIVDLGTSFGIAFKKDRREVELHVLEGRVRVDASDGQHGEIIQANRSVLLDGMQVKREIDQPTISFLRNLPAKINMLLKDDFDHGLIAGHSYIIRMDRNVIRDLAGKHFRGIDDYTTWNFTTMPNVTPTIITPVSATSPTPALRGNVDNLIDGSGLSARGVSGHILSETHSTESNSYSWLSQKISPSTIEMTFDLGGTFTVDSIHIWNWIGTNRVVNRSVKTIDISFSTDGGKTYGHLIDNLGDFAKPATTRAAKTPIAAVPVSTIAFPAAVSGVTHIKLTDFKNHGDIFTAMSEIRFGEPEDSADKRLTDWDAQFPAHRDQTGINDDPDTPPDIIAAYPADNSTDASKGGQLKMLFSEPIKFGSGRVLIQNVTDWSENELAVWDGSLSIDDRVLTINPRIELEDGAKSHGWLAGWKSLAPVTFLNPRGDGKWYNIHDLQDDRHTHGMIDSMRSKNILSIHKAIHREIGTIAPDSRYTVSVAIGVRADDAKEKSSFPGYTIRLSSGDTVLAQLTSSTPPGPANSINTVGFSWDATTLPAGIHPGDPLSIEIAPNQTSGHLDLNALRISVLGKTGR